jgi:hypothetical protein
VALDPVTVWKGFVWWTTVKPFKKFRAWRARRRGKRMAVETGLRSSSNMVIAGGLANIVVEILQMIWPEFVLSAEMRTYLTLGIAWLASRFTRTPEQPKVL